MKETPVEMKPAPAAIIETKAIIETPSSEDIKINPENEVVENEIDKFISKELENKENKVDVVEKIELPTDYIEDDAIWDLKVDELHI